MALLLETVNGILPVFLVIFSGAFFNRLGFFSEITKDEIVKLVYYIGTPALLFHTVANAELYQSFHPKFVLFLLCAIIAYLFLLVFLCRGIKNPSKKAAVIQLGFRSNFAIVGIPLAMNLMAEEGVLMTAISLAFVTILYNVSAVFLLSYYGKQEKNLFRLILGALKNPLIIGTLLGLLFSLCGWKLPFIADKSLETLGSIASSMGLLMIGATITVTGFQKNRIYILWAVFFRNLLAPVLFLMSAVCLGYRGDFLVITAILSATPSAVNCFVMAKKMGADPDISAYGVSLTCLCSIVSIFCSVYFLKLFGLA
ncbi:MAG: AEC family transporter [Clostridia bacterium]|nr:AEC family transporter [Clostridia bacterium]